MAKQDKDPDALPADKQREFDKDQREFERQTREVEERDGGPGIRSTDMPTSDKQQSVDK